LDERPVRDQGRCRVRTGGESACVAHGALPVQGGRRVAGEDRGQGDGWPHARGARVDRRPAGRRRLREEPGVSVRPFPRRGHDSRARDEIDRGSDGGASSFGVAFAKAQLSIGQRLPEGGTAFVSVNNDDKPNLIPIARDLAELGFRMIATRGTAAYLRAYGLDVGVVFKVNEGRPNIADEIVNRKVDLVVNTPLGRESFFDDRAVRRAA